MNDGTEETKDEFEEPTTPVALLTANNLLAQLSSTARQSVPQQIDSILTTAVNGALSRATALLKVNLDNEKRLQNVTVLKRDGKAPASLTRAAKGPSTNLLQHQIPTRARIHSLEFDLARIVE